MAELQRENNDFLLSLLDHTIQGFQQSIDALQSIAFDCEQLPIIKGSVGEVNDVLQDVHDPALHGLQTVPLPV